MHSSVVIRMAILCIFAGILPFKLGAEEAFATAKVNLGIAPGDQGSTGLRQIHSAIIPPGGTFSVGGYLQYWQMKDFLKNDTLDQHLQNRGTFSLAVADFWELFIAGYSSSHLLKDELLDTRRIIQVIGDLEVGSKWSFPANPFLWMGLDVVGAFRTKRGEIGYDWSAGAISSRLLFTFDWTTLPDPTPFRITLNLGYLHDWAYRLLPQTADPFTRYMLGVPYDDDAILGGIALEIPQRVIDFYLAYSTEQYFDQNKNLPPELARRTYITNPQRFTPGIRIFPTRGMVVDLSADLGHNLFLTRARYDLEGLGQKVKIEPDWIAHLGLSYVFLPPAPEVPQTGRIEGFVYDARDGKTPLAGAVISFPNQPDLTRLITDKDGRFKTYEFRLGTPVAIRVEKDHYQTEETTITLLSAGATPKNFYLKYIEREGVLRGQIFDTTGRPLPGVIEFPASAIPPISAHPQTGLYQIKLEEGTYTVKASAPGYLPRIYENVTVSAGKETRLNFVLERELVYGILRGSVRNAQGYPVTDVVLRLDKPVLGPFGVYPQTGTFETSLPPGSYQILAQAPGYKPIQRPFEIQAGAVVNLDIVLEVEVRTGRIIGKVVDAKTGKGVAGIISFPNGERENLPADPDSGAFVVELKEGTYEIKAAHPDYNAQTLRVQVEGGKESRVEFRLEPFEKIRVTKEKIEIKEQIFFQTGKAVILQKSFPLLDEIANVLKQNPQMKIVIEGHTDNVGNPRSNKILSQKRAEAVRQYLISRGISGDRLTAIGYGSERPIAPNTTEEGRAKNRRVEFKIIEQ